MLGLDRLGEGVVLEVFSNDNPPKWGQETSEAATPVVVAVAVAVVVVVVVVAAVVVFVASIQGKTCDRLREQED